LDTVRLDDGLLRTTAPNGLVVLTERLPGVRSAATGFYVRTASIRQFTFAAASCGSALYA
jgi:hypothetical protein